MAELNSQSENKIQTLITQHIDLWTGAVKDKSSAGRGSSGKRELYGIKKLRELILELAVRGKLVAQDPSDEPASVLLERIATEKEELIKQGKIKKPKKLPEISEEEKPFELPKGWEWCRIQEVGHDLGQKQPQESFSYIDVGTIDKVFGVVQSPSVIEAADAPSRARKIVKQGTVIYSTIRPYLLNIAIIDKQFEPEPIASTAFAIVHPLSGIVGDYVYRYLRSLSFVKYVESVQTGVAYPAINDKQFQMGVISVPPTNEQHRIVAKVDELMALCDQLEQQTASSLDVHQTLVQTLLDTLLQSADTEELEQNWQRLSAHFDLLFTTEQSIDQLKQTILQLAVMGKLVPQDPNDEPASELLKRIAAEKEELVKQKKIKKQKPLPPISDDEKPFELPERWGFERIGNLVILKGGFAYKSNIFLDSSDYQIIRMGNIRPDSLRLDEKPAFIPKEAALDTSEYEVFQGDVLLTMTGTKGKRDYLYSLLVEGEHLSKNRLFLNQRLCLFRALVGNNAFLNMTIKSDSILDDIFAKSTGTANQANIGMEAIQNWVVPVPPMSEQHRIVTKVDQLMALCDQLKAKLADSKTTQLNLTDALVDGAIA